MRSFEMTRNKDETGISGTGKVVEGIVFSDGTCVTRWVSENSPGRATSLWDSFGSFIAIHVAPHPGNNTQITFSDGEKYEHTQIVEASIPRVSKPRRRRKAPAVGSDKAEQPAQVGLLNNDAKPKKIS